MGSEAREDGNITPHEASVMVCFMKCVTVVAVAGVVGFALIVVGCTRTLAL